MNEIIALIERAEEVATALHESATFRSDTYLSPAMRARYGSVRHAGTGIIRDLIAALRKLSAKVKTLDAFAPGADDKDDEPSPPSGTVPSPEEGTAGETDTRELRRLAEYAGPDRWVDYHQGYVLNDRDDAAFINAANPRVILQLLDELDAYRRLASSPPSRTVPTPPSAEAAGVPDEVRAIIERLRRSARGASDASRMIAQAKSDRNRQAAGKLLDGASDYMWLTPEQTNEWKAADALERLAASPPSGTVPSPEEGTADEDYPNPGFWKEDEPLPEAPTPPSAEEWQAEVANAYGEGRPIVTPPSAEAAGVPDGLLDALAKAIRYPAVDRDLSRLLYEARRTITRLAASPSPPSEPTAHVHTWQPVETEDDYATIECAVCKKRLQWIDGPMSSAINAEPPPYRWRDDDGTEFGCGSPPSEPTVLTDEAVDAAAAVLADRAGFPWAIQDEEVRWVWRNDAKNALRAAIPLMGEEARNRVDRRTRTRGVRACDPSAARWDAARRGRLEGFRQRRQTNPRPILPRHPPAGRYREGAGVMGSVTPFPPQESPPDLLVGPFQVWQVVVDGRFVPGLTGHRDGEGIWLTVDHRFTGGPFNEETAIQAANLIGQAMAVASGYASLSSLSKDRPFAPKAMQITDRS